MGIQFYTLYNYLFYLFGTTRNDFFLLYVLLVTLSGYALVLSGLSLPWKKLRESFDSSRKQSTFIPIFMLSTALLLGGGHGAPSMNFVMTGGDSASAKKRVGTHHGTYMERQGIYLHGSAQGSHTLLFPEYLSRKHDTALPMGTNFCRMLTLIHPAQQKRDEICSTLSLRICRIYCFCCRARVLELLARPALYRQHILDTLKR